MALALFDLDNTLLNGDSDHAWGIYLCEIGAVDVARHCTMQDKFYADYLTGTLDIDKFLDFHLAVLTQHPLPQLLSWRDDFINAVVTPMIQSGKAELLEKHRHAGDTLVIITATNDFITGPIADLYNVDNLIATQAEMVDGVYTGRTKGTPCYQQGKVTRLKQWMMTNDENLTDSWFYSDSKNDLPLLNIVDNPVAVTPDNDLRLHAEQSAWPVID